MKNCLFIGNSFIYYNELPTMLQNMTDPAKLLYNVDSVTRGGAYLHDYLNENDELFEKLENKLEEKEWDCIVLQDQSRNPALNPLDLEETARAFAGHLDCELYFYQTWAYKDGSEKLEATGYTYDQLYEALKKAYINAAAVTGASLVPVGDAFKYMHDNYPEVNLYQNDGFHPLPAGTYLAASLFAMALFGIDPDTLPGADGVSEEERPKLIEAVKSAASAALE